MEERFLRQVRGADPGDRIEEGWRLIEEERDTFEPPGVEERPWPADRTVLYWWRPTFWRR